MTEDRAAQPTRERVPDSPGSTRSMRARLARMGRSNQPGNPVLEPLFRAVRTELRDIISTHVWKPPQHNR